MINNTITKLISSKIKQEIYKDFEAFICKHSDF